MILSNNQQIDIYMTQIINEVWDLKASIDCRLKLLIVHDLGDDLTQSRRDFGIPTGLYGSRPWAVLFESSTADTNLQPSHSVIFCSADTLVKNADVSLGTEQFPCFATNLLFSVPGEQL